MPMTMIAPERRSRNLFDLIVTLDDATSEIHPAFLVEEEGTFPSFRGLAEVIARHGARGAGYRPAGTLRVRPAGSGPSPVPSRC